MIVPITSSHNNNNNENNNNNIIHQHNNSNSLTKPDSNNPNPNPNPNGLSGAGGFHSPSHAPSLCYEPTSVLDLRRSASPVATAKGNSVNSLINSDAQAQPNDSTSEWDEHLHSLDWDTIMRDLGLHDDSVPPFKPNITIHATDVPQYHNQGLISDLVSAAQYPQPFDQPYHHHHHHHNQNADSNNHLIGLSYDVPFSDFQLNSNIGFDFIEDLIRVADCVDSDDSQLAQAILDRLNQRLRSGPSVAKPVGRALQRSALCYKDALQSLIVSGSNRTNRLSSWSEIVQAIKAYKDFSVISPIPMFSHFTTNQALLEALHGSQAVHVIDFDIGLGGQYASLMRELAEKHNSSADSVLSRLGPPILRVTAIVPEEYAVESRLVRENLTQFAQHLKIRFHIEFVLFRTFQISSFKSIKLSDGEKTAVILSAATLRRVSAGAFLADVRRLSPAVVVFVDGEGLGETAVTGGPGAATSSFRRSVVGGLEFYSMVMESLDAAMAGAELARKIEAFVLRPRVFAAVEAAATAGPTGRKMVPFREAFHAAGLRPLPLSQFADFQAECLLARVQVRGFHVATRQTELVLCWHERVVVATSVWRC